MVGVFTVVLKQNKLMLFFYTWLSDNVNQEGMPGFVRCWFLASVKMAM